MRKIAAYDILDSNVAGIWITQARRRMNDPVRKVAAELTADGAFRSFHSMWNRKSEAHLWRWKAFQELPGRA